MSDQFQREVDRLGREIESMRKRLHGLANDVAVKPAETSRELMNKYLELNDSLTKACIRQGFLMAKAGFPFPEAED